MAPSQAEGLTWTLGCLGPYLPSDISQPCPPVSRESAPHTASSSPLLPAVVVPSGSSRTQAHPAPWLPEKITCLKILPWTCFLKIKSQCPGLTSKTFHHFPRLLCNVSMRSDLRSLPTHARPPLRPDSTPPALTRRCSELHCPSLLIFLPHPPGSAPASQMVGSDGVPHLALHTHSVPYHAGSAVLLGF